MFEVNVLPSHFTYIQISLTFKKTNHFFCGENRVDDHVNLFLRTSCLLFDFLFFYAFNVTSRPALSSPCHTTRRWHTERLLCSLHSSHTFAHNVVPCTKARIWMEKQTTLSDFYQSQFDFLADCDSFFLTFLFESVPWLLYGAKSKAYRGSSVYKALRVYGYLYATSHKCT